MSGRRGRRTNWEGITLHIGSRLYSQMRASGQATAKATPTADALMRLGRAAFHACADTDRQDKREAKSKIREVKRGHSSAAPRE
jgi:hypothetical protein